MWWSHCVCHDFITIRRPSYGKVPVCTWRIVIVGPAIVSTIGIPLLATEGSGLVDNTGLKDNTVGGERDHDTQLRLRHSGDEGRDKERTDKRSTCITMLFPHERCQEVTLLCAWYPLKEDPNFVPRVAQKLSNDISSVVWWSSSLIVRQFQRKIYCPKIHLLFSGVSGRQFST